MNIDRTTSLIAFLQKAFVAGCVCLIIVFLLMHFSAPGKCLAQIQSNEDGSSFEFTHATMSDGVRIALAVGYPKRFETADQTGK